METEERPHFGALLRRLRTAAALSQEQLAERSGLSVRGLSDLERSVHRAPRLETVRLLADALALPEHDRAELLSAARAEPAAMMTPAARGSLARPELPLLPTRLIGRQTEQATIRDLLANHEGRLTTLTGPGGTGKTHLALSVATDLRGRFRDGVCLVDLSPLTDAALVVSAIATALGVRETASEPIWETLSRQLRERQLLLLLDNCEQVLAAAPHVAALLAQAPQLVVLATSRVPLHIRAEREVSIAPLSLPDPARLPPLPELEQVAAVALFVERARAARADFALHEGNAPAVAAICQRLDGLPLAIELAAARVKVLPPAALLSRLEQRLLLLTGGGRDLPERQRTMHNAIAWSYDLLAPDEQILFRRLAVFAGGCTLEAAEAVASEGGQRDILSGVATLVDSSLLRQEEDLGYEPRFRMLETVREYGLEQLALAGEIDQARARHAANFMKLVDRHLAGRDAVIAALTVSLDDPARLASEHDNLRLALAWFDEQGEIDTLLRLSLTLYGVWFFRGSYREGLQWFERALTPSKLVASTPRVHALTAAARMAAFLGDFDRAATFVTEGLSLARELGNPLLLSQALSYAGYLSYRQGEYGSAEDQLGEAHRLLRDYAGDIPVIGVARYTPTLLLGDTALAQEQFDLATRWYAEVPEVIQAGGSVWSSIDARAGLAGASYCKGNYEKAAVLYLESLRRAQDLAITLLVATSLLGLAGVAAATGSPTDGARLLGATEGILASLGTPMFPRDRPIRERAVTALMAALGEERFAAAQEAGRALTIEEAIAEAMAVGERALQSVP